MSYSKPVYIKKFPSILIKCLKCKNLPGNQKGRTYFRKEPTMEFFRQCPYEIGLGIQMTYFYKASNF